MQRIRRCKSSGNGSHEAVGLRPASFLYASRSSLGQNAEPTAQVQLIRMNSAKVARAERRSVLEKDHRAPSMFLTCSILTAAIFAVAQSPAGKHSDEVFQVLIAIVIFVEDCS